jgi:hypothetical protein
MSELSKQQIEVILEQNGDLEHLYHEGQQQIYDIITESNHKELILFCSRRYGKSFFLAIYTMMLCLKNPNYKCTIVSPSKLQTSNIVQPIFRELIGRLHDKSLCKFGKSENRLNFKNGSQISLTGFDTCVESMRGTKNDFIGLEESGMFNQNTFEYNLKSIIMPTLAHSKEKLKIIHCTTPSMDYEHPINVLATSNIDNVIKLTIYDNPLLDTEQIDTIIEECGGVNTYAFQTEYMCEVVRHEASACLPSFSSANIFTEDVNDCYIVGSWDDAGSRDNSAYVEGVYINNKIHVIFSHTFPAMTDTETKATFLKTRKYNKLVGDIAGVSAVEFAKHGINFQFPNKVGWEEMLVELDGAFRRGDILIHSSLKELIGCLESTKFNKNRTDYERTIKYAHSDLLDSVKYLWRMKHLFTLNQKQRQRQDQLEAVSYDNTSYIHELKRQLKEKKLAENFKFKRRNK